VGTGRMVGLHRGDAAQEREKVKEQRDRVKKGSDAFSTIYPDIGENDVDLNPQKRVNSLALNTPKLAPKGSRLEDEVFSPAMDRVGRAHELAKADLGSPRRPTFISANNVGMNGLVNLARENSRSLSPSKVSSPVKGRARTSTYGASVFGTPKR